MTVEHTLQDINRELTRLRRTLEKLEATLSRIERESMDDGY